MHTDSDFMFALAVAAVRLNVVSHLPLKHEIIEKQPIESPTILQEDQVGHVNLLASQLQSGSPWLQYIHLIS